MGHPGETVDQAEGVRLAARTCKPVSGAQLDLEDLRVRSRRSATSAGRGSAAGGVEVAVSIV